MWTPTTRMQHSRPVTRYQIALTDAEWRVIAPHQKLQSSPLRPWFVGQLRDFPETQARRQKPLRSAESLLGWLLVHSWRGRRHRGADAVSWTALACFASLMLLRMALS